MTNFLEENPEAAAWVDRTKAALSQSGVFGQVKGAVIWSDALGPDSEPLVPVDPQIIVADINAHGYPLLFRHDPGFPLGKVIQAEVFTSGSGEKFVAAVLGFYDGARLSFRDLGLDPIGSIRSPARLPPIPDNCWITLATDPREVNAAWVQDVVRTAPMRVVETELSHNAADTAQELIHLGVLFMALVWNPFVTTIATEAGKDAYSYLRRWLRGVVVKLGELRSPIFDIQSHHNECDISFLLRGKNAARNCAAIDALPGAAAQAQCLIVNMKEAGCAPKLLVYELAPQDDKWFPSFAELRDGRFITDNNLLTVTERLPSGMSLGIRRDRDKPGAPILKHLPPEDRD